MQSGWRPQTAATYSLSEKARFGKDYFCFFLPLNASKRLFPAFAGLFRPPAAYREAQSLLQGGRLKDEDSAFFRPRTGRGAAAARAGSRALRAARDGRDLRPAHAGGPAAFPTRARPERGRRRGPGDARGAAALVRGVSAPPRPRGRELLFDRAALRRVSGGRGACQQRLRERQSPRRRLRHGAAALCRRADGDPLVLRARGLLRARALRALSLPLLRLSRAQRAGPPAVVAHARRGREPRALQRRAPRQRMDHDAAAVFLCRGALRGLCARDGDLRPERGGAARLRASVPRAARRPGRTRSRDGRAAKRRGLRPGEGDRGAVSGDPLPLGLEGQHPRHGPEPAVPRRLGDGERDQGRGRDPRSGPGGLGGARSALRAREPGDGRADPALRPRAGPRLPHAGRGDLLALRRYRRARGARRRRHLRRRVRLQPGGYALRLVLRGIPGLVHPKLPPSRLHDRMRPGPQSPAADGLPRDPP